MSMALALLIPPPVRTPCALELITPGSTLLIDSSVLAVKKTAVKTEGSRIKSVWGLSCVAVGEVVDTDLLAEKCCFQSMVLMMEA